MALVFWCAQLSILVISSPSSPEKLPVLDNYDNYTSVHVVHCSYGNNHCIPITVITYSDNNTSLTMSMLITI